VRLLSDGDDFNGESSAFQPRNNKAPAPARVHQRVRVGDRSNKVAVCESRCAPSRNFVNAGMVLSMLEINQSQR
jgi:hypothetical protein